MATVLVIESLMGGAGVAQAGATKIPKGFLPTERGGRRTDRGGRGVVDDQ